jgi:hypothetical protein
MTGHKTTDIVLRHRVVSTLHAVGVVGGGADAARLAALVCAVGDGVVSSATVVADQRRRCY